MYIYNVHHSCVAGTLTWVLDTAAAVSVCMSKKSCTIITIKEECQVAKTSGLGADAFFLSNSLFASPSFIAFLQFYKCQFIKRSNLNVGLISNIDLVMDLPSNFKPVCQRCLKIGASEPFTGCRIQMWNYTLQVRCVMSTWQHIYCYGHHVQILVFTYSTLAA